MQGMIAMALEGKDVVSLAESVRERHLWGPGATPENVEVDSLPAKASERWIEQYADTGKRVSAYFDENYENYLIMHPAAKTVRASFNFSGDLPKLIELLSDLPFEVASFAPRYRVWYNKYRDIPGFGGYHFTHGWACAFRGDGHARLASRRWLDHGPWRLYRGANDTSFVQFHDLELDEDLAYAQAKFAHQRMGITDEGGYLQSDYVYQDDIRGFYNSARRVLELVVIGRTVSAREMRDACAARRDQVLGPEQPIDNVAFVFLDPSEADRHVPRLWPYGLECWTIINEVKTRLDSEEPPEGTGA
ncbi:hypothetical protein ACFU9X_39545 [Streptomyces atratus]|uniref:hypothetical protein n=1 Tax=Streptomyces atratus TaxID=1893 RepID=UPI0036844027